MKTDNKIVELTFEFSLEIINVYKLLVQHNEYVISKQLLRSATSIGANVEEANAAQTKKNLFKECPSLPKKAEKQNIGYGCYIKVKSSNTIMRNI